MIKMRDFPRPVPQSGAFGRQCVYRVDERGAARIENELRAVEQLIACAADRSRQLAEELGERYAVFRGECKPYDTERDLRDGEIMKLSKRTDECIEAVYKLEKRRRELLEEIGK